MAGTGFSGFYWVIIIVGILGYMGFQFFNRVNEFGFTNTISGCSIKGTRVDGHRVYLMEWQEGYNTTIPNQEVGNRVFCTESDAKESGYNKSNAPYWQEYLRKAKQEDVNQQDERCNGPAGSARGC